MSSRALIIFCRTPEAEARAKGLPVARTAPIFEEVLATWIRCAQAAGAKPFIASSAEHRGRLIAIAPNAAWIEQGSGSFGARLSAVTTAIFARGFESVALTGIDTPPMDLSAIFECWTNAIVPAKDGGINVIALIVNAPELLASLRPRQHDAAKHCARVLEAVVLPAATDLDDIGDLRRALQDPAWAPLHHLLARASINTRVEAMLLAPGAESFITRAPPVLH